jgi:Tol biopolymer transport system component
MIRLNRWMSVLMIVTLLMVSLAPIGGGVAVEAQGVPEPFPEDCDDITPLPDACCMRGYVYQGDTPLEGASVRIESAHGQVDLVTASGGLSGDPYYSVYLSDAPLSVSAGDTITLTASYGGMVSSRTWMVQEGGQQVDLGVGSIGMTYPVTNTAWTRLTTNPYIDVHAAWSPDGSYLAWTLFSNSWNRNIWEMNAGDGSAKTQLTSGSVEASPDYSPDGQRLLYGQYYDDSRFDILVKDLGTGDITVVRSTGYNTLPRWSPDGNKILFTGADQLDGIHHIYVMDADGGNVAQLTTDGWLNGVADWSPDGTRIAFQSDRAGSVN